MPQITKASPPTLRNLMLLARQRAIRIHIGVAVPDIASPRDVVTLQVTSANDSDKRVEAFRVEIDPRDGLVSQRSWSRLLDAVDTIAPQRRILTIEK